MENINISESKKNKMITTSDWKMECKSKNQNAIKEKSLTFVFELEKLELQPRVVPGPHDIPHQSIVGLELSGALFRYINCLIDIQCVLQNIYIYTSHSELN